MYRNRREAIEAFCKECIWDSAEKGTWRDQVEACEMTKCQLHNFRPKSIATERLEGTNANKDIIARTQDRNARQETTNRKKGNSLERLLVELS